jgi:hypothetical protein
MSDPLTSERHDSRSGPFGHHELGRRARLAEAIVVDVEPVGQPEARMQRKGADEGSSRVAGLLEQRRSGARLGRQTVAAVVAQAMLKRELAREDARVRRQGEDGVGMREIEADALGGEPIERRRCRGAAIRTERIGAERVDGDEQDVLLRYRVEIRLSSAAAEVQHRADSRDDRSARTDPKPPSCAHPSTGSG